MPHFLDMLKRIEKIIHSASEQDLNVLVDLRLDNPYAQPAYINCDTSNTKGPFPTKTEALMYRQMLQMEKKLLPKEEIKKKTKKRPVKLGTKGMEIAAGLAAVIERVARAGGSAADTDDESSNSEEEGPEAVAALTESMIDCRSTPTAPQTPPPPPHPASEKLNKTAKSGPFGYVELPIVVRPSPRILQLLSLQQKLAQQPHHTQKPKTAQRSSDCDPSQNLQAPVEQPNPSLSLAAPVEQPNPSLSLAAPVEQPNPSLSLAAPVEQPNPSLSLAAPVEQPNPSLSLAAPVEQPNPSLSLAAPVEQPTAMFEGRLVKLPIVIQVPHFLSAYLSRNESSCGGCRTPLSLRSASQLDRKAPPVVDSNSTEPPAKRRRIL